jgi:hypothetical protein
LRQTAEFRASGKEIGAVSAAAFALLLKKSQ